MKFKKSFLIVLIFSSKIYSQDTLRIIPFVFYSKDTTVYFQNEKSIFTRTEFQNKIMYFTQYRLDGTIQTFLVKSKNEQTYYNYDCEGRLMNSCFMKKDKRVFTEYNVNGVPIAVTLTKRRSVKILYTTTEYARDYIGSERVKCASLHISP